MKPERWLYTFAQEYLALKDANKGREIKKEEMGPLIEKAADGASDDGDICCVMDTTLLKG